MTDIRKHSDAELRKELGRREAEQDAFKAWEPKQRVLLDTLDACREAIAIPPGGSIGETQTRDAAQLLFELSYRCLPGGSGNPLTGMSAGWARLGEAVDKSGMHSYRIVNELVCIADPKVAQMDTSYRAKDNIALYQGLHPRRER